MATKIPSLPVEYVDALDEALVHASYAARYAVDGAEFVNGRQVSIPDYDFGSQGVNDYDRFATEDEVTINRTIYTLDHDKEGVFYVDAADAIDEAAADITKIVAEYQRVKFAPAVDSDFFAQALAQVDAPSTTALSAKTIIAEIRKARSQFTKAGLSGGDLYVTSDVLGYLEDATTREFSNETTINDTVGIYNGFNVFEVADDLLGCNMLAISGGTNTYRYITQRAAAYAFAPGAHTGGDGWLSQNRWIYGMVAFKNKKPGFFANKKAS